MKEMRRCGRGVLFVASVAFACCSCWETALAPFSFVAGSRAPIVRSARRVAALRAGFESIPSPAASDLFMRRGSTWIYLDVRNPGELRMSGVPVVAPYLNVPSHNPDFDAKEFVEAVEEQIPDKDTGVVVGCARGIRSKYAAAALAAAGYTKLREVGDGFYGWLDQGLPVKQL